MWAKIVQFVRTAVSDRTAEWWSRFWQGPWTLDNAWYANCTHQNHKEGKWRPIRRWTGQGTNGDERQALSTFTSQIVRYARTASEGHEQKLIELGHPNASIRNPAPSKREWDEIQSLHPKVLLCTTPMASGMSLTDKVAVCKLLTAICWTGLKSDQLYLKIQKFHAAKLEAHLESGGKLEDFKCRIHTTLLNKLVMQSNKLMYAMTRAGSLP